MLLFKPAHIAMIQAGKKVETRRIWARPMVKVGAVHLLKTRLFTKDNFGRIRIEYLRQESLLSLTDSMAYWEGCYTRAEYLKVFREIYPDAPVDPMVWVIGFRYIGGGENVNKTPR